MSIQTSKTLWASGLFAAVIAMGQLSKSDAQEQQQSLMAYCEGVVIWEVEKRRGIPLANRAGHLDWNDRINVAEQCPGMRPAGPAIDDDYRAPARLAMPETVPIQQIVQF